MGLWGAAIQYQLLSWTGLSGLMCRENNKPDNCGFEAQASGALDIIQLQDNNDNDTNFIQGIGQRLELVKTKNIQNKPHNIYIPQSSGHILVANLQVALAVTNSTSPGGRVAQHKIWGPSIVAASDGSKQVKPATFLQDCEDILCATGSKSSRAWMSAESLANFCEEVPSSTWDLLFKLIFPPHIGSLFCNLLLEMFLKKISLLEERAFLDKEVNILSLLSPDLLLDKTTA
eukprot:6358280-Ditylum_brightwellii.AAC.1